MALFLTESAVAEEPVVSLVEAQLGLIEAATEVAELNEALLRADFIIHEQSRSLNEADQEAAKEGFLQKAGSKIKEVAKKVKEKVVAFFKAAAVRLKRLWAKITGKDKNLKVPKGAVAMLEQLLKLLDNIAEAANADASDAKAYTAKLATAVSSFSSYREQIKASVGDHSTYEEVKPSVLSKVNDAATRMAGIANSTKASLEKAEAAANKGLMAKIPGTDKNSAVQALRATMSGANQLASAAGSVLSLIGTIVGVRAAE